MRRSLGFCFLRALLHFIYGNKNWYSLFYIQHKNKIRKSIGLPIRKINKMTLTYNVN